MDDAALKARATAGRPSSDYSQFVVAVELERWNDYRRVSRQANELTDNDIIIINDGGGSFILERVSRQARELLIAMLIVMLTLIILLTSEPEVRELLIAILLVMMVLATIFWSF